MERISFDKLLLSLKSDVYFITKFFESKNSYFMSAYGEWFNKSANGINALHFEDLLREIKLIRDRRTTVK